MAIWRPAPKKHASFKRPHGGVSMRCSLFVRSALRLRPGMKFARRGRHGGMSRKPHQAVRPEKNGSGEGAILHGAKNAGEVLSFESFLRFLRHAQEQRRSSAGRSQRRQRHMLLPGRGRVEQRRLRASFFTETAEAQKRSAAGPLNLVRALVRRDEGCSCAYCGATLTQERATLEHIVPISGGALTPRTTWPLPAGHATGSAAACLRRSSCGDCVISRAEKPQPPLRPNGPRKDPAEWKGKWRSVPDHSRHTA